MYCLSKNKTMLIDSKSFRIGQINNTVNVDDEIAGKYAVYVNNENRMTLCDTLDEAKLILENIGRAIIDGEKYYEF
jgi:hypothetical protein